MRLGHVIGKVTLSKQDPAFKGARFLLVQPFAKPQFQGASMTPLAPGSSLVVYDNLGADLPRTRVPERDPWGLRAVAALLLVTAFAFSFGPTGGRLSDGFNAHGAHDVVPPRIDAWVTPPAYTGKPPIFLTADANQMTPTFTVPDGSDVSLRVTGGSGEETLAYAGKDGNSRAIDPAGPQAAATAKPAASPATPSKVRQFTGKLTGDGLLDGQLGALKMPVLIVWGKQDHLIPLSVGEAMHHEIPQSELEIFDGCGHLAPNQCAGRVAPVGTRGRLAATAGPAATAGTASCLAAPPGATEATAA